MGEPAKRDNFATTALFLLLLLTILIAMVKDYNHERGITNLQRRVTELERRK